MKIIILTLVMMCGSAIATEYVRLELINNNGVVDYSIPAGKMLTRVHTTAGFIGKLKLLAQFHYDNQV